MGLDRAKLGVQEDDERVQKVLDITSKILALVPDIEKLET
jgi:hypothetical protein